MGCSSSNASKTEGKPVDTQNSQGRSSVLTAEEQNQVAPTDAEMEAEKAKIAAIQGKARRAGVAAESVSDKDIKDYKKPVYEKDQATKEKLRKTLKENDKLQVLFGHLDGEPLNDVINAFYSKEFGEGIDVIKQGDAGNCLYIVDTGNVDIFVQRPGMDGGETGKGQKVLSLGAGALFGELALMYNAPRAATVTATSKVCCFTLDALDFKMLLAQSSQVQYAKYEGWLQNVDILKSFNHFELAKLSEVLESQVYDTDEVIIKQGDEGDKFFLVEDGEAKAFIAGDGGEKEVKQYKLGDYFGEIALLTNAPRKATIRATGTGCSVASLTKEQFTNMLGPIEEVLKKDVDKYPAYAEFLKA